MSLAKRILVAPLNWGLGHATRCMPIIDQLLQKGVEVILASDGRSFDLLGKEYPNLTLLQTPSYSITYKTGNMVLNIAPQLPKILQAINREHKWLNNCIKKYKINAVVSDNRYGMNSPKIPSVFLTHQVNLPVNIGIVGNIADWNSKRLIKKFSECWIPDLEGATNLSGSLSHPANLDQVRYIGLLSRLKKINLPLKYDLTIVLSGPEPQRTILEEKIKEQLPELALSNILLIRGVTETQEEYIDGSITIKNFLTANELTEVLAASKLVVARSGYSTIMDLVKLGKQAIFIPTPGQTEQEYLAEEFYQKRQFYYQKQKDLNLQIAIKKSEEFKGLPMEEQPQLLESAIDSLLAKIK